MLRLLLGLGHMTRHRRCFNFARKCHYVDRHQAAINSAVNIGNIKVTVCVNKVRSDAHFVKGYHHYRASS